MILTVMVTLLPESTAPRTRGDDPIPVTAVFIDASCSPHARG